MVWPIEQSSRLGSNRSSSSSSSSNNSTCIRSNSSIDISSIVAILLVLDIAVVVCIPFCSQDRVRCP